MILNTVICVWLEHVIIILLVNINSYFLSYSDHINQMTTESKWTRYKHDT
jgi:hypothetical protein